MEECEPEDIPKVTSQADEMRLGRENTNCRMHHIE